MKYFVFDYQRDGGCYHEFYKGKWDGHTFWKKDSILLDDDILCGHKGFIDAVIEAVPSYDPYGVTEISQSEWQKIGEFILEKDASSQALFKEADIWLKNNVFPTYTCFTILGM